jgi:hypothetical protein
MKEFAIQCLGNSVSSLLLQYIPIMKKTILVNSFQSIKFFQMLQTALLKLTQLSLSLFILI